MMLHRYLAIVLLCRSLSALSEPIPGEANFYMIFASDPQLYWVCQGSLAEKCHEQGAQTEKDQAILSNAWQTESINRQVERLGPALRGVIVNGDLTAYGHPAELDAYRRLFRNKIRTKIFPGLGNHDYKNNILPWGSCWNSRCPALMTNHLVQEVKGLGIKNFDWQESRLRFSWKGFSLQKEYQGSLAYAFDIGRFHFVQLNHYPSYTAQFNTWNFARARRDYYKIESAMPWLAKDLAQAQADGKRIVINMHDTIESFPETEKQAFVSLIRDHDIVAIFSGHLHEQSGPVADDFGLPHIPQYRSGSSATARYLLGHFKNDALAEVISVDASKY